MTLNQLIYFQTIAKYEHFRLAAAELNLSQPSLSRSIATLEEELGVILFERNGRNVNLTKSGKVFLEHVDRILEEVHIAQKQMQKLSGDAGHIDIAYVFPLAASYIPHTVRRFLNKPKNKNVNTPIKSTAFMYKFLSFFSKSLFCAIFVQRLLIRISPVFRYRQIPGHLSKTG